MRFDRNKRISEEIKKIVSNLILNELKDPRIPQFTSITHVETTNDHRYTYIYISFLQDNINVEEAMNGLNKAAGFVRREIGKNISLYHTPEPVFRLDESIKNAMHIEKVIHDLDINHESDEDE
ncbi:MAG: 30S ribosome-binding factor RbfA [Clostridiales bacterium]|nr:30S ribosome-binding factor RbfA [Clostridiales bacterium]